MNYELLNYLKSSIDRHWLRYYADELSSNREEKQEYASKELYELTKAKVDIISAAIVRDSQKLVIFVVESNPLEFIAAFLAGVITEVNIFLCNPSWQQQEWQQVLDLVIPDLIFGDETGDETVNSQIAKLDSTSQQLLPIDRREFNTRSHIMIPTGGTSGEVKFAIHTWETLTASVNGFKTFFECEKINSVCTLPLYHVSGLMQLMRSLLTQGNLIICDYKLVTEQLINADKSTYFISLVPTQLQYLVDLNPHWLKEFKTVLVGGAPPRRSLLNTAIKYNIPVASIYGMTETASGIVALTPKELLTGNDSNGRVLPHAKVAIDKQRLTNSIDAEKLRENKIGLIAINSTSLCLGYYPQLLSPTRSLVTDDIGYFDSEGYLYLVGRNSQKIITGGENVFPGEVEKAIYATNLVKDVCVIGIPDGKWGQAVTAIYVPTAENILDSVKQQMRSQLAKYKQPKNWIKVNCIPRNNRGKVNYRKLKAIALHTMGKQTTCRDAIYRVSTNTKNESK